VKVPPFTTNNVLDMPNEWLNEGNEEYFEKLIDIKMIVCVHRGWNLFMKEKLIFHMFFRLYELFRTICCLN